MSSNEKGSVMSIIIIPTLIFIVAIVLMSVFYLQGQLYPQVAESFNNTEANETLTEFLDTTYLYDGIALAYALGLFLSIVLTSFLIRSHPAFIWLYIFAVIIATFIAAPLSNAYIAFESNFGVASSFGMTHYIMTYLPTWTFVIGIGAAVMLYAKTRSGGPI